MTSPHQDPATPPPSAGDGTKPRFADRVYRSMAGIGGGILLLVLAGWLGGDAIARGGGRTPWLSLAALLLAVPLIVAFTLRPAVFANAERIRVRNPFRTVTIPWEGVDRLRASYSTELFAGERKYQVWAIPVSLRARKRAARQTAKAKAAGDDPFRAPATGGRGPGRRGAAADDPIRSWSDKALDELRDLAEQHPAPEAADAPRPAPAVRWCYEVIAPAVAGAVVLIVLIAV